MSKNAKFGVLFEYKQTRHLGYIGLKPWRARSILKSWRLNACIESASVPFYSVTAKNAGNYVVR